MIYAYECQECGLEQEKWHKLDEENEKPCEKCEAPPEKLKKIIAKAVPRHVSWSTWRNLDG